MPIDLLVSKPSWEANISENGRASRTTMKIPCSLALVLIQLSVWMQCSSVSGIMCFACDSVKSWADCEKKHKLWNCTDITDMNFDVCHYWSYKDKDKNGKEVVHYLKSCGSSEKCDGKECKCNVQCCSTDLCNYSAAFEASRSLLVSCALVQLLLL